MTEAKLGQIKVDRFGFQEKDTVLFKNFLFLLIGKKVG